MFCFPFATASCWLIVADSRPMRWFRRTRSSDKMPEYRFQQILLPAKKVHRNLLGQQFF